MTHERGLLGLYWPAREEPLETCARRAFESLAALKALGYEHYYFRGRSRRDGLKRVLSVTPEAVLATLAKGRNYADVPRKPIVELGWRMGLWSGGADDECYGVDIHCGAYSEHVGNSVVMELPPAGAYSLGAGRERARRAYDALVAIWSPETAVLCEGPIAWEDGRIVTQGPAIARYP